LLLLRWGFINTSFPAGLGLQSLHILWAYKHEPLCQALMNSFLNVVPVCIMGSWVASYSLLR
jgi:hypothetical protein